jgi:hypothetical protein
MYVAGGRGNFGLQALARPMHSASQAIVDIWIFVSSGSPCFYSISHNPMRAWVSALQWHIVPLFFAWSLAAQVESMDGHSFLSLLLMGGFISCLITWTSTTGGRIGAIVWCDGICWYNI